MDVGPALTVFLSHSHRDKPVARRLARELAPHRFRVWLDERELRLGATLTATIRRQIETSDVVLVVASAASAESKWVRVEIEQAQAHDRTVVPFLVEPVADREPWREEDWAKADADAAHEMRWYVHTHAVQALGQRDWLKAMEDAKRTIEFEKRRKALLDERDAGTSERS